MLRLAIAAAALLLIAATALQAEPAHGIALYGTPKQPPGFTHFPYVNADAPKGGRLTMSAYGSFDSTQSADRARRGRQRHPRLRHREPHGARARRAVHALRPHRRDGRGAGGPQLHHLPPQSQGALLRREADHRRRRAVLLRICSRRKGGRNHRTYFAKVAKAERLSDRDVRFTFESARRPRDPAHPRAAAGAAEAPHQSRHL